MEQISPSDLKAILHSKRANLYYLEMCKVVVNGGRVEYITDAGKQQQYWNIPIANTTSILLGTGTSITQAAMHELAKAGVLVGFCGGGGTPLYSANEVELDIAWFSPQSEYRPVEYLHQWLAFWQDEEKRLLAAKQIQAKRIGLIQRYWIDKNPYPQQSFNLKAADLNQTLEQFQQEVDQAANQQQLMLAEARLTKQLYKHACKATGYDGFTRAKRGSGTDPANRFLDHGNYLAYGLGATATWVLGLPHGLSVLHGTTRRGGLVFDAADLIKDALVLPQAFVSAMKGDEEQEFRQACLTRFNQTEALDFIIDSLKEMCDSLGSNQ